MSIEHFTTLEPGLKQSIAKYKRVGATGLLNGNKASRERLTQEIAETVKCFCIWSDHEEMKSENVKLFVTNYLFEICKDIK